MAKIHRDITTRRFRIKWLLKWLEMRNYNIRDERKAFLCIIYNTAKAYLADEAAKKMTIQINNSLSLPFSREKLQKHIFDSIDKRSSILFYKNKKIKEVLKITDEEYAALDVEKTKRERDERFERKIARKERDEEIVALYQQGVPKKEIAKQFGISKSTVHKTLTEKLQQCNYGLYLQVRQILDKNKRERHIRGGMATKLKYKKKS